MSIKIFEAGLEGTEYVSARLNNVLNHEASVQIDKMFERLWDGMGNNSDSAYSRDDFERVAFSSKRKAEEFLNEMNAKGVPVVASSCKLNGQFLAEIPKQVDINSKSVTSDEIISQYQYDKQEIVKTQKEYKDADVPDIQGDAVSAATNNMKNLFISHLEDEDLKRFVNFIDYAAQEAIRLQFHHPDDEIFKRSLDQNHNVTKVKQSEKYKTATVINGDTVIIDGKIVKDERVASQVLEQHRNRIDKAYHNMVTERKNISSLQRRNDAFENTAAYKRISSAFEKPHNLRENFKSLVIKHYDEKSYDGFLKQSRNENMLRHETIYKNSKDIFDKMYRQEFTMTEQKSYAVRRGGALDDLKNSFNTEMLVFHNNPISLLLKDYDAGKISASRLLYDIKRLNVVNLSDENIKVIENTLSNVGMKMAGEDIKLKDIIQGLRADNLQVLKNSEYGKIMFGLKKDLGLDFIHTGIQRRDILKINSAFIKKAEAAGIQLVNKHGTLDVKALSALPVKAGADVISLDKLGISAGTRDIIVNLNKKGAWGNQQSQPGLIRQNSGRILNGLVRMTDDEDFAKMVQTSQQMVSYTRKIVTSVHQFQKSTFAAIDIHRAGRVNLKTVAKKPKKTIKLPVADKLDKFKLADKVDKIKKRSIEEKKKALTGVNQSANQKFLKKQDKKLKKLEKSEKRIGAKVRKNVGKFADKVKLVTNKAKEVVLKFLIKFIAIFFLIMVILEAALLIIGVVVTMIQSLFNWDPLAPDTYKETVCYKIYQCLQDKEEEWIDIISDSKKLYDNKENLSYGMEKYSYDDYVNVFRNLKLADVQNGELYINPFGDASLGNKDAMTKLGDNYNGKHVVEYSSNLNSYGIKPGSVSTSYISTESGHTSNLKDIIAMLDIMYQFDMEGNNDGSLESVMGMAPAQLVWDSVKKSVKGFFKWIAKNAEEWWDSVWSGKAPDYVTLGDCTDPHVTYATLQRYVVELFMASHQQQLSWSVDFYDICDIQVNVDGENKPLELTSKSSSEMGICSSPVTKKFELGLNANDKVVPCLVSGGVKYDLTDHSNDQSVYLSEYTGTDSCLWTGMGNNAETLNKIIQHMDNSANPDCWQKQTVSNVLTNSEYLPGIGVITSDWHDNEDYSINEAKARLKQKWKSYEVNSESVYNFTKDTLFSHEYYKKYNYINDEINVSVETQSVEDGKEFKQYYWTNKTYDVSLGRWIGCGGMVTGDTGYGPVYYYVFIPEGYDLNDYDDIELVEKIGQWLGDTGYEYFSHYSDRNDDFRGIVAPDGYNLWSINWGAVDPKYKTLYQARVNAPFRSRETDQYMRVCKGHDFTYCGGHLSIYSQGIVYSMTNEQLAKAGMYSSKNQVPVIKDFDFEGFGYGELIGKHIPEKIDYSTVENAAKGGSGVPSASVSVQGSDVSTRGLNLYVSGGLFKDGYSSREDVGMGSYRDIFDVDCAIDKGCNVFPWGSHYEEYKGWDSDNMFLAIARVTNDWNNMYEFDIPTEIGGQVISEEDIELIVDSLSKNYGDDFTKERREAVTLALEWVGRGHYSENHKDHAFLSKLCDGPEVDVETDGINGSISYDVNCTASDDEGFVKFILNRGGKMSDTNYDISGWSSYNSSGLLPADILKHDPGNDLNSLDMPLSAYEYSFLKTATNAFSLRAYLRETYVLYLGKLSEDITLSDGTLISAGETLTIDLNPNKDGMGVIRLRTVSASDTLDAGDRYTYYWVDNPDDYSFVHRY